MIENECKTPHGMAAPRNGCKTPCTPYFDVANYYCYWIIDNSFEENYFVAIIHKMKL